MDPTEEMRERARQLVELHVDDSADWPLAQLSIAQALADEFARGISAALSALDEDLTDDECTLGGYSSEGLDAARDRIRALKGRP